MNDITAMDFLLWVKGPTFQVAFALFLLGIVLRLLEIFMLGRALDHALARSESDTMKDGLRTVISRSLPDKNTFQRSPFTLTTGYIFHIGLFVAIFLFIPHIEIFRAVLGFGWPGLPSSIVDALTAISIVAMVALLIHRISDPVMRFLSGFGDYLAWTVTFLPLLTGYMAYHHLLLPYTSMLALHILSVELLLVVFPFSKLMHAITLFISRWYNGVMFGRKGVQS